MPRRSSPRSDAVYRITLGVTKEERDIIRATAEQFGKGTGELLWLWICKNVEHYAKDPLVQEWIARQASTEEEPGAPAGQELTKEEVLKIIESGDQDGP